MYYEWYIDLFFLENTIMDAVLLILLGIALRQRGNAARLLLASLLGGAGACALVLFGVKNGALALLLQTGLAALMVKAAFPGRRGRRFLKGVGVFYALAFLMGGVLEAVRVRVSIPVTVSGLAAAVFLAVPLSRIQRERHIRENLCQVTLSFHGISKSLRGFRDTGNQLTDPYFGNPVAVVEKKAIEEFLNQKASILWIPYHSIGHDGAMAAFKLDYMLIEKGNGIKRVERPLVAVSQDRVSAKGSCQILLPSSLVDD